MSRDDIEGILLLVVVFIGCLYHNQLADLLGLALNHILF
jgi:hypothetical protein